LQLVIRLGHAAENVPIAGHALWLDAAFVERLEQGAAGFAIMLAVAKATMAQHIAELDETGFHIRAADMHQPEFAYARRIDQLAATGEMKKPCGGGGVSALAGHFR